MDISLNGFNQKTVTFECDDTVNVNSLVKISGNGKVSACVDGEQFCGICINKRGNYCSVQLCGYANIKYTTDSLTIGYHLLAASGADAFKLSSTNGRSLLVTDIDETNKIAGIIL